MLIQPLVLLDCLAFLLPDVARQLLARQPNTFGRVSLGDSDVPVYHPSHLLVPLSICCPSLHFASGYYLLDSLWGTFAYSTTWILSLLWFSPASMDLVLWDCSCAMMISQPAFFVATGSHFLCQWYILCRGQVVHDVSSLCSSSVFSLGLGDMA